MNKFLLLFLVSNPYAGSVVNSAEALLVVDPCYDFSIETEKDSIIVASYGVYSTGVNIKNLHNIIFAHPGKSKIRVLQSIGRGLRTSESKSSATLYDIVDDLSYKAHKNFAVKHFVERYKYYMQEKFPTKLYKVDLKF